MEQPKLAAELMRRSQKPSKLAVLSLSLLLKKLEKKEKINKE